VRKLWTSLLLAVERVAHQKPSDQQLVVGGAQVVGVRPELAGDAVEVRVAVEQGQRGGPPI
jgi:hypothetical protein